MQETADETITSQIENTIHLEESLSMHRRLFGL